MVLNLGLGARVQGSGVVFVRKLYFHRCPIRAAPLKLSAAGRASSSSKGHTVAPYQSVSCSLGLLGFGDLSESLRAQDAGPLLRPWALGPQAGSPKQSVATIGCRAPVSCQEELASSYEKEGPGDLI